MKKNIIETLRYFSARIAHKNIFYLSLISFLTSFIFSSLHYSRIYYGNSISWIGWIVALLALLYSFIPAHLDVKQMFRSISRPDLLLFAFVAGLYFISHLLNYSHAPWNINGLFDDAAWDIYFAKNHVFNNTPFQAAFFDNVGYISREVVFHYYISIFFVLFGYNLLVFNISLLLLGFVTVLFTTLIVHKLFNNIAVTLISAVVINFLPLHFMHIFVGHRYAISTPLMVISLYYLYTSFSRNSYFRISVSAIFAALTLGSAIMGKQYLYGLALSVICVFLCNNRHWITKEKISIGIAWLVGFIIAATPLIVYIIFNNPSYAIRESSLIKEFLEKYKSGGLIALQPYLDWTFEVFFAKHTYRRWFLPDFPTIPLAYYVFILPGLFLAFTKKRFEIIFLSVLPVLGAFISGAFDFRVLLAAPIWVICMAFTINYLFKKRIYSAITIGLIFLSFGLFSSIKYIWTVSKNPNYFYLLPHKDVAVSRLVQDIVLGVKNPTSDMKWDEFNRKIDISTVDYDTFVSPTSAYAIMHLYLQNFNDKKILSFIAQGTQQLSTPEEIFNYNFNAINNYISSDKDLKLVWEISDKTTDILKIFQRYNKYGKDEILSDTSDGNHFSLYILTIKNKNINAFKEELIEQVNATDGNLLEK